MRVDLLGSGVGKVVSSSKTSSRSSADGWERRVTNGRYRGAVSTVG